MSIFYTDGNNKRYIRPITNPTTNSGENIVNPENTIDIDTNEFAYVNASSDGIDAGTPIDYRFANPLIQVNISPQTPIFIQQVSFKKHNGYSGTVTAGNITKSWADTTEFGYVNVLINQSFTTLSELVIIINTDGTAFQESKLYDVRLYITIGKSSKPFEFNDSVLTTKAWNSSRYDGRQLSGSKLNKFTAGDSSYGLTPVISNLTRTFYISSDITSLSKNGLRTNLRNGNLEEDTDNPIEDPSLHYIPDFSYVIVNKSVTINKDNSIKVTDLSTFNTSPGGINRRTGFDREFQTNIPDGSFIGLKNLDADIKDRSDNSYKVYFNAGRLQPMFIGINNRTAVTGVSASKNSFHCTNNNIYNDGTTFFVPNMARLKSFLPPSVPVTNTDLTPFIQEGGFIINNILGNLDSNKRFFVTLLKTEGEAAPSPDAKDITPIRTTIVRSISGSNVILPTQNLAELSTAEIASHDLATSISTLSKRFSFNQNYGLLDDVSGNPDPANFSGSFAISHLNEEKPALLLNLTKEVEFPEGIGRTPLVIIPETLHPYIKDNIPQFMARAGFDIGNITQVNTLDETNRNLS